MPYSAASERVSLIVEVDDEETISAMETPSYSPLVTQSSAIIYPILVSLLLETDVVLHDRMANILSICSACCEINFSTAQFLRKPARLEQMFELISRIMIDPDWSSTP